MYSNTIARCRKGEREKEKVAIGLDARMCKLRNKIIDCTSKCKVDVKLILRILIYRNKREFNS